MVNDSISDMLSRIRNGLAVKKETVAVVRSKTNEGIAQIIKKHGFIKDFKKEPRRILLSPKYLEDGRPAITRLGSVSKPGLRIYRASNDLPWPALPGGVIIVSTSAGLMTAADARKKGVGGEVVCEVD